MIAQWGDNFNGGFIDLLIEKQKGFTLQLLKLTDTQFKEFPILFNGPYGHLKNFGIYSTVILFVADIGITGVIPYVKELLESSQNNQIYTKKIVFIWRYSTKDKLYIKMYLI